MKIRWISAQDREGRKIILMIFWADSRENSVEVCWHYLIEKTLTLELHRAITVAKVMSQFVKYKNTFSVKTWMKMSKWIAFLVALSCQNKAKLPIISSLIFRVYSFKNFFLLFFHYYLTSNQNAELWYEFGLVYFRRSSCWREIETYLRSFSSIAFFEKIDRIHATTQISRSVSEEVDRIIYTDSKKSEEEKNGQW